MDNRIHFFSQIDVIPKKVAPEPEPAKPDDENKEPAQAPTETLQSILTEFGHSVESIEVSGRSDFQGVIVIEDWQTNLKKVTVRILWTDDESGEPGEYSQTVYLHKDSNYDQGE